MIMKKVLLAAIIAAILFTFPAAFAQEKVVVTSFYPIYILAMNLTVGIEDIRVENLAAPNTGCLHDYQLLTGDMRTLSGAQVLLINGAGMESYLDTVTALKEAGIAYAAEQIIDLLSYGVDGIHLYTMNRPEVARQIISHISSIRSFFREG
jgi:zinc transport system substrate-binding protein